MTTTPPTIVFMGTPDFAVPTLKALHRAPYSVPLVVTQPDRPKGRGRRSTPSPVKTTATQMGLTIAQPVNVREPEFLLRLKNLDPDFLVVVAYGQILPDIVLAIPRRGPINVHASLLPKYRGPAPIQWAIMRGESQTGVTTILMDRGVDTGDTLLCAKTPIDSKDTADTLHDRLAVLGADLLVQTIDGICKGTLFPKMQQHTYATYAPLLKKTDGRVDWQKPAHAIDAMIRAMTPWPGAFCFKNGKRYKIHKARPLSADTPEQPGCIVPGFPDELRIATGEGVLSILEIQGESGKRMLINNFLRGCPLAAGEIFE